MESDLTKKLSAQTKRKFMITGALLALVIGAMALDTTVVKIGSDQDVREKDFSADDFGVNEFPSIQRFVNENAVEARELMNAIQEEGKSAGERYGVSGGIGPVIPVKFLGAVGASKSGIYNISIKNWPLGHRVRVQTGPAINGTELRDATGDIEFGDFKNQIEYQNVGSALNRAMKVSVLSAKDTSNLVGKTIEVTGVFRLINVKNWLVTPVRFEVK